LAPDRLRGDKAPHRQLHPFRQRRNWRTLGDHRRRRMADRCGFNFRFHPLGFPSCSRELFLNFLELPLQQLGLAFEPLDLRSLRGLCRSRGGHEQPSAQEGGARHQLLLESHDRLLGQIASASAFRHSSATIARLGSSKMTSCRVSRDSRRMWLGHISRD
jgi:hypothetical protein